MSTVGLRDRLGKESVWGKRQAQDYHVVGSDASGVMLKVGSAVRNWKPGDRVVVHCNHVDDQDPSAHDDSMLAANQRIWGFETNFGGLADLSVVKADQLMPKPEHPPWQEAAVNALRTEGRRGGSGGFTTSIYRWSPYPQKKKNRVQ